MKKRKNVEDIVVDTIVYVALTILMMVTIIPFMQVVTISMSPAKIASSYGLHLLPVQFDFSGYKQILNYEMIWRGYFNTISRVFLGTSISVILLVMGAYPLSKKYLPHRHMWTAIVVFTMYFSGGLIPTYMWICNLGLYNSVWALVLPCAVGGFNLLIVRNFFMSVPEDIEEAARIDGANDILILVRIVLPLSKPILATVALWSMVYHWNEWFNCLIYISSEKKYMLQLILRKILLDGQQIDTSSTNTYVFSESMKMAALIVSIIPIICVYPFLQKYFVKGVMIGSLKG